MKQLLLILFLLPTFLKAQSTPEPFKKANIILVTFDTLSTDNAFKQIGRTFLDAGYTINKSDKDFLTIETNYRQFAGKFNYEPVSIILRVSIKKTANSKTVAKFSGTFGFVHEKQPGMEITYRGMKGSMFMASFDRLEEVAKRVAADNNGQVNYSTQ